VREAGAQVVTPYEGGLAGTTDESWLAHIGSRRWLALMRDQNIKRRALERRALVSAKVGAFVCTTGEATADQGDRRGTEVDQEDGQYRRQRTSPLNLYIWTSRTSPSDSAARACIVHWRERWAVRPRPTDLSVYLPPALRAFAISTRYF